MIDHAERDHLYAYADIGIGGLSRVQEFKYVKYFAQCCNYSWRIASPGVVRNKLMVSQIFPEGYLTCRVATL